MFGSRLILAPCCPLNCHLVYLEERRERSEGSAFLSGFSFSPPSPFLATLADHSQLIENATTLSLVFATLTEAIIYFTDSPAIDFPALVSHTDPEMDSKPNPEYDKFKSAMKRFVTVPLSEIKALEKKKKRRPKRPSASRVAASRS